MNNHKYIHLPLGPGTYYIIPPPLKGAMGSSEPPRVTICRLVPHSDRPHEYRFFPKLSVVGRQNGSMFDTAWDLRRFYDLSQAVHGELQIRSALRLPLTGAQLKALGANTAKWGFEEDFFAKDGSGTLPTYHTPCHMGEYFTEGRWVGVEMDNGPKGRTVRRAWLPTGPAVTDGKCVAAVQRALAPRQEEHEPEEGGRDDATIDREWGLAFASVSDWTAGSEPSTSQNRALLYLHQTPPQRCNDPLTETPYELMWASARSFIADWTNSRAVALESRQPAVPQDVAKEFGGNGKELGQTINNNPAADVPAAEASLADKTTVEDDEKSQAWAALRKSIEELKKGKTAERTEAYEAARRTLRKLFDEERSS